VLFGDPTSIGAAAEPAATIYRPRGDGRRRIRAAADPAYPLRAEERISDRVQDENGGCRQHDHGDERDLTRAIAKATHRSLSLSAS